MNLKRTRVKNRNKEVRSPSGDHRVSSSNVHRNTQYKDHSNNHNAHFKLALNSKDGPLLSLRTTILKVIADFYTYLTC